MPKMPLHRFVEHLVVADGGLQERIPIDQPLAAIDLAFLEEIEERSRTARRNFVERESRALPVAATAHLLQLADDPGFIVVLPLPNAIDQAFAAQFVPAELLLA